MNLPSIIGTMAALVALVVGLGVEIDRSLYLALVHCRVIVWMNKNWWMLWVYRPLGVMPVLRRWRVLTPRAQPLRPLLAPLHLPQQQQEEEEQGRLSFNGMRMQCITVERIPQYQVSLSLDRGICQRTP